MLLITIWVCIYTNKLFWKWRSQHPFNRSCMIKIWIYNILILWLSNDYDCGTIWSNSHKNFRIRFSYNVLVLQNEPIRTRYLFEFLWYSVLIGCFLDYEYKLVLKSLLNIRPGLDFSIQTLIKMKTKKSLELLRYLNLSCYLQW